MANRCHSRAGEGMVTVDVWRDLLLLGRVADSPVKTSMRSGGAECVLGRGWVLCPRRCWEQGQNLRADQPGSNWAFLKGGILKQPFLCDRSVDAAGQTGARDIT